MKERMVIVAVIGLVIGGVFCLPGCTLPREIDPQQVQRLAELAQQYQEHIDAIQADINEASKLAGPEAQAKVARLQADLDRLQDQVGPILEQIQAVRFEGKSGLEAWLAIAQAANAGTAGYNPYRMPIAAALSLVGAIVAAIKARKNGKLAGVNAEKAERFRQALTEVVVGTEHAKKAGGVSEEFKKSQQAAQSVATELIVSEIRRDVAA